MTRQRQELEELRARCEEYSHAVSSRNSEVEHLRQANLHAQRDIEHLRGAVSSGGGGLVSRMGCWSGLVSYRGRRHCLDFILFPMQLQCSTMLSRHRSSNTSPYPSMSDSPDIHERSARVVSK